MTRFIYVDGEDVGDRVRIDELQIVEAAYGCDVGQGGIDRDDLSLEGVPAMKPVIINELAASPTRLFTGYTSARRVNRGPLAGVENQRQFDVTLLDVNTLWDDPVLEGTDSNRPEETDYARMTWLVGTDEFAALGIAAGVLPNTNTVQLDARDYRGEHPRVVAEECMEAASKNAFLYDYGSGPRVYYDLATGSSLSSSARISTVLADVDEPGGVFGAELPELELDPERVYSKVRFEYAGGHVSVTDAGTAAAFRARAVTIRDDTVKNATRATNKANKYLDRSSTERPRFTVSVSVPAANVNDIRQGQRIQMKLPHLTTDALDVTDWTWFRIARRTVVPQPGRQGVVWDRYTIRLEFADNLRPAGFGGRDGPGGDDNAATEDGSGQSLIRYQLFEREPGPAYFTAIGGGSWNDVPADFTFGVVPAPTTSKVARDGASYNITWPYGDCGIVGGVWAGRHDKEAWYELTLDLSDTSIVGVRLDIAAPTATLDAVGATILVGAAIATPTGAKQFVQVGTIGDGGGSVFVPISVLQDDGAGSSWLVLAPGWEEPYGYMWCGAGSNPVAGVAEWALGDVTATAVVVGGTGLSPWVPGVGAVDGSNTVFSLPNWNGDGTPEVRVGNTVLGAGEYTFDGGALTVTFVQAPPADMAGQVAFRFRMG